MLRLDSSMFRESAKSHASKKLSNLLLSFIAVFLVIYLAEAIIPGIISSKPLNEALTEMGYYDKDKNLSFKQSMKISEEISVKPHVMIPYLFCTVFGTLISIGYCHYFELRKVSSMGVRKRRAGLHYASGLIIGILMMALIVLLSAVTGTVSVKTADDVNIGLITLYLLGFLVQGMSEEFIFRGYFMTTLGANHSPYLAIGISSAAFSLFHAANPGISPIALLNLFLFGVFAAVYMIHTNNIWGVCAIHSMWNFSQGNLFGISVSGSGNIESLLVTSSKSSNSLLTGGKFGIEGSIFTTVALAAAIAAVLILQKRREAQQSGTAAPTAGK